MFHLVLADDSQTIQKVVRLSFAGEDCTVRSFSSGPKALEYLKTAGADIVLVDSDLPEMDGYDLCRKLKSNPATVGIPVVLLTAAFVPLDRERAESARFNASISKPFEPNELVTLVRKLLGEPPETTPIRGTVTAVEPEKEDEIEFPSTFMSLPRPPVEGEILFELTPEQCRPSFQVLRHSFKIGRTAAEPPAAAPVQNVDELVLEIEKRLRSSLRGLVSEVAREYINSK